MLRRIAALFALRSVSKHGGTSGGRPMLRDARTRLRARGKVRRNALLSMRAEEAYLRALAQRRQPVGVHGAAFRGTIAHLSRVIRRVLFAAQRLARELDEMVRDEAHPEHRVDLAVA